MDYDGYERRPPQAPKPLSRQDDQRIAAERQHEEEKRQQREIEFLAYFQSSPAFAGFVAAQDLYNEYDKSAIAAAAAETAAQKFTSLNVEPAQVAEVVRDTVAFFSRQQNQERAQQHEASASRQPDLSIEPAFPSRPGPTGQWPGKYAELEELSQQAARDDQTEEIARRQQEESDKRQTLTPDQPSQQREPSEQEHKEAGIEQNDRKQERGDRNEVTDGLAKRRDALFQKYGYELTSHDEPDHDRGREQT
jgi:hypothetical protein